MEDEIRVHLNDGESWNGLWPSVEPPKGMYIFPLDSYNEWINVDFHSHFWCRPMAEFLDSQRTVLRFALPYLDTLLAFSWEIEADQQRKTIFRSLQVFARLSLSYSQVNRSSTQATVLDHRSFIMEGLRANLDKSNHVVAKQIAQMSKQHDIPSKFAKDMAKQTKPRGRFKPRQPGGYQRFGGFQNRGERDKRSGPSPGRAPRCFKCGKMGHIKKNCRSSVPTKK